MAFITCSFSSKILQQTTQFNVIIPRGCERNAPVLYLLHGLTDDYSAWARYTSIERYANEAGFVVIMPDGGRGFYTDMLYGGAYYTFFAKELFQYISELFSVSQNRDATFIAGISMGGYGALKLALLNPHLFGAAASLSGAVDVVSRLEYDPRWSEIKRLVFGEGNNVAGTKNDLFHLVENYKENICPRLYVACGTEDFLFQNNKQFESILLNSTIPFMFNAESGVHDWDFWDKQIQKAIAFFANGNL